LASTNGARSAYANRRRSPSLWRIRAGYLGVLDVADRQLIVAAAAVGGDPPSLTWAAQGSQAADAEGDGRLIVRGSIRDSCSSGDDCQQRPGLGGVSVQPVQVGGVALVDHQQVVAGWVERPRQVGRLAANDTTGTPVLT
jgi:hypothetical protein